MYYIQCQRYSLTPSEENLLFVFYFFLYIHKKKIIGRHPSFLRCHLLKVDVLSTILE